MLLHDGVVNIGKPNGMCLPSFVVDEYSELFSHPSIFSIKHLKST